MNNRLHQLPKNLHQLPKNKKQILRPPKQTLWPLRKAKVDRYHRRLYGQVHHIQDHIQPEKNEPPSSSWKKTYDNIRRVKKRAQEMNICLCCASDAHSLADCDNEFFSQNKKEILACFDHIEKILKVNFTDYDEVIIKRDQAERERREQRLQKMTTRMSRWRT